MFCGYPVYVFDNSYYGLMRLKVSVGEMRFSPFFFPTVYTVQRPVNAANEKVEKL